MRSFSILSIAAMSSSDCATVSRLRQAALCMSSCIRARSRRVHSAAPPPSRSPVPAGAGTAGEVSSGGGYVVAVASERSVADADAVFRNLQAKFPNQLGGREPIMRRTDLGPKGTYYQASIGPLRVQESSGWSMQLAESCRRELSCREKLRDVRPPARELIAVHGAPRCDVLPELLKAARCGGALGGKATASSVAC
jgi:hypothetical protein